jgi:hypothetical protein
MIASIRDSPDIGVGAGIEIGHEYMMLSALLHVASLALALWREVFISTILSPMNFGSA